MSGSSQILVLQEESDEPQFTEYKEKLLSENRSKIYAGRYLCQDKIGDDFVNNSITDAAILVVNIFNENIIGFAAISRYNDDHGNPYLYIDLICNSPPSLVTRKGQRLGAKAIIDRIEALAISDGCSSIKLSAVGDVIPYYYRLGYEFDTVFLKDGKSINETLKREAHELITELRTAQIERSMKKQEKRFIKIIHRFFPGYLSEKYQSDVASKSGSARTGPASDQGIPMTKLLPRVGAEAGAAAREGGRRIHKKKTIRRKYKKERGNNKTRKYL
jgi:hypothetical protein